MFLKVTVALLFLTFGSANAQEYVGSGKCKLCHKKEDVGNQYAVWQGERHSKAYLTLGTPEAKSLGATVGVADPQKDERCLVCHTTAYDQPASKKKGLELSEGVSCEECHGPGSKYKPKEIHGESHEKALAAGVTDLECREAKQALCLRCHGKERNGHAAPNYKPFDLDERLEKIAHPLKKKNKKE